MLLDYTFAGSLFLESPKIIHILVFLFVWVLLTGRPGTPKETDILGMCQACQVWDIQHIPRKAC